MAAKKAQQPEMATGRDLRAWRTSSQEPTPAFPDGVAVVAGTVMDVGRHDVGTNPVRSTTVTAFLLTVSLDDV